MARGSNNRRRTLVPEATRGMERLKYETARELGVDYEATGGYGGDIPSKLNGAVGGHMVRKMIAAAEHSLADQTQATLDNAFWGAEK